MERAVRYSKKREAILTAIRETDCHPSAEWLYQRLKPPHPDLSLGTVYRNLAFFQRAGQVKSVGVVRGQERFDAVTTPHSHFVCSSCGTILDLPEIYPEEGWERTVSAQYGFTVERCELIFHGECPNCQNQNFKEEALS